jgi:hypothetical protein
VPLNRRGEKEVRHDGRCDGRDKASV